MALWTPADITTALWLDASDASTFTLSGHHVTEWRDKGGPFHFNQTNIAHQPTRVVDGGVLFTAPTSTAETGHTFLQRAAMLFQPYPFEVFIVADSVAGGTFIASGQSNTGYAAVMTNSAVHRNSTYFAAHTGVDWSNYKRNILHATFAQTLRQISVNGGAFGSNTNSSNSLITSGFTYLGRERPPSFSFPSSGLQAVLREVIVVKTTLTTLERQQIEGYLANKWGLLNALPVSHPFRTNTSVSGIITDDAGQPASRSVRIYDRATGALRGTATSNAGTGAYNVPLASYGAAGEVQRIVLDDDSGTLYNDIIDRVIPG